MAASGNEMRADSPPITPPRITFLGTVPEISDEVRWDIPGRGIKFKPQRYDAGWRDRIDCTGNHDAHDPPAEVSSDFVDAGMFVVGADQQVSTYPSLSPAERKARLADQLKAIESYEVANEFWTGGNIDAGVSDQRVLRNAVSDTLTTSAVAPDVALGIIEQGLAQLGKGQRGMVHMTMQALTALVTNGSIRREGNSYLTASDNWVVADAGYPGTGPAGHARTATSVWMFGTSMVRVRLGTPIFQGIDGDAIDPDFVDRSVNDLIVRAYRPVMIVWDEAVHVAAETNLTLALVGGAS